MWTGNLRTHRLSCDRVAQSSLLSWEAAERRWVEEDQGRAELGRMESPRWALEQEQ